MTPSELVSPDLRVRAKTIDPALVGARIKHARHRAGLTQGEAAGDHMSTAYMSRIEAGHRRASAELLVLLAERLGCDPEELLAEDEDTSAAELVARLTLELDYAELDLRTGRSHEALARVDAVLAEEVVPQEIAGQAAYLRALALESTGDLDGAITALEDVVAGPVEGLAMIRALIALTRCYREEGDLARACEVGERAEGLVDAIDLSGSAEGIQLAVTVAAAHFERGDVNHALRLCKRAVASAEKLESPTARASAYWNSSIVHQRRGDVRAALPLARKAVALLEQSADARNMARLRGQLGLLQLQMDPPEVEGAVLNLNLARSEMASTEANAMDRGRIDLGLAKARLLIGDDEEAERLAEDTLNAAYDVSLLVAAEARTVLGQVAASRGRADEAVAAYRHAIVILDGVGAERETAQLWFELGTRLQELGVVQDAIEAFRRAGASSGLTRPQSVRSRLFTSG